MQILPDNDRFGFYRVGEFRTYSKLEAIERSGASKIPVEWDFNQSTFSKFDWTQEPAGSLDFWYKERAQQLRDKYDYIVLWFSGGADSHNVLMSFVKNNIFIDEIAQYHNLEGDNGNKQSFLNEEVFATSAPVTLDLIENNPVYKHTKHRLVDITQLQTDVLLNKNKWDYFYQVGTHLSPNALARSYLRETLPEYQSLIDQGKSVCFLYGADKPLVQQHGDHWYLAFRDMVDNAVSPRTQMLNRAWEHNELFYWSDTLPQLVAKQAHVVQKFLSQIEHSTVDNIHVSRENPVINNAGTHKYLSAAKVQTSQGEYNLLNSGLHQLIYPDWRPDFVVCGKPISLAASPRDTWMFNASAPDIGQRYYNYGMLHMRETIKKSADQYWWEHRLSTQSGTPYNAGMKDFYNLYRIV